MSGHYIIQNISRLVTCSGSSAKHGREMNNPEHIYAIELMNAAQGFIGYILQSALV